MATNKTSFRVGHIGYWLGKKKPPMSQETKKKISQSHMGLATRGYGWHHVEETKKKIGLANSISNKGKKRSSEIKERLSKIAKERGFGKWMLGRNKEQHWNWQGGKSFEPYSLDWTASLRRTIRERDHYICQLCQKEQGDIAHDVHHIDYNKQNCDPKNLITLCHICNIKVNHNREYWTNYFNKIIEEK